MDVSDKYITPSSKTVGHWEKTQPDARACVFRLRLLIYQVAPALSFTVIRRFNMKGRLKL